MQMVNFSVNGAIPVDSARKVALDPEEEKRLG